MRLGSDINGNELMRVGTKKKMKRHEFGVLGLITLRDGLDFKVRGEIRD